MATSKNRFPGSNRIAEVRKRKGLSQAALAEAVDAHWITISKLERGVMQLTSSWLDRIAEVLHVGPADLLSNHKLSRTVSVEGVLNAGGAAALWEQPKPWTITRDDEFDVDSMWMEVRGEALWPLFQDGDLIRFTVISLDEAPSFFGRLCVGIERPHTSESPAVFGFLDSGSREGRFDIRPMNLPPKRDLDLETMWIAIEAKFRAGWEEI